MSTKALSGGPPAGYGEGLNLLGRAGLRAKWWVNNIRLKVVGTVIAGLIGAIFLAGLFNVTTAAMSLVSVGKTWNGFESSVVRREALLSDLRHHMGFGGASDHLHRLALGHADAAARANAAIAEARAVIAAYRTAGAGAAEMQALAEVTAVLDAMEQAVVALVGGGDDARLLAGLDTGPAVSALEALAGIIAEQRNGAGDHVAGELAALYATMIAVFVISGALLLVLAVFLYWFIRYRVVYPLYAVRAGMMDLAEGNKAIVVAYTEKEDEVGDMARALEVFRENAIKVDRMHEAELQAQKEKEARQHRRTEMTLGFEAKARQVVGDVLEQAGVIETTATGMGSDVKQSSARSLEVADAAERATRNLEDMAASAEELSASIRDISAQVEQSAVVTHEAVSRTRETNDRVAELSAAAEKIGAMVALINEIAEQTHLLALNANIEATRAGDAGKGFVVVAGEVKNLAGQTASATHDIAAQVAAIQNATQGVVGSIDGITQTIEAINDVSQTISQSVAAQETATHAIAETTVVLTRDAQEIFESIGNLTRASASSYHSSIKVLWSSQDLQRPTTEFQKDMTGFLDAIRAN